MEDPGVSATNFNGSNIDSTALTKSVASSPALFESTIAEEDNDLTYNKQIPSSFSSSDDESATFYAIVSIYDSEVYISCIILK
jgi:hypothetical protein